MTAEKRERGFWRLARDVLSGSEMDFTSGPINRGIWVLAIPMVLEMVMESLFAVVDMYFVAKLGSEPAAAVGLTESLMLIVISIGFGLSLGITALVSRRMGEKDRAAAERVAVQAIWVLGVLSAVIGVSGWFLAEPMLRVMGGDEAVVAIGSDYARLMLGGSGTLLFLFGLNGVYRGAGDASMAMRVLWLANGLNIVLDPCLIMGWGPFPELGVTGAAAATNIGRGVGVLYQLYYLFHGGSRARLRPRFHDALPDVPGVLRLLRVSLGGIAQFIVATSSWIFMVRLISDFGNNALAGYTIGNRVLMFALLPAWGLSGAAATLVGQNLGAKNQERAERSVWLTGVWVSLYMAVVTIASLLATEPIMRFFTKDLLVVAEGASFLSIVASFYLIYGWQMVFCQAFNGAGDTMTPTRINLFCYWLVQIPLGWLMAHPLGLGAGGVYWAIVLAEAVGAAVAVILFRKGRWRERQV